MARKSSSVAIPLLLIGIAVIIILNWVIFFPWTSQNHSATSDSIDRHEKLIAAISAELDSIREVSEELRDGTLRPFDKRVREALKGGNQDVQDYLNSPLFSEEAGKRPVLLPLPPRGKEVQQKQQPLTPVPVVGRPSIHIKEETPPIEPPINKVSEPVPDRRPTHPSPPPAAVRYGAWIDGSTLVVGGTDGSGTRRVVEVLTQLGVSMVSEDPETYDIHADIVGGWPKIVDPVIKESHGLKYDPNSLSDSVRAETKTRIAQVLEQAKADSTKPESRILARGGRLTGPDDVHAAGVSFGIKAPVSMVMVPWWREISTNFKFLHVVRDGRDIAFSANQGPVNKFYAGMYPQASQRQNSVHLKAIQLWSDWNSQIHEWSQAQPAEKDGHSYGYMLLHTEDLVDERVWVKFGAMRNLAAWVHSDASDDYICCLAIKGASFMGSHDRTARTEIKSEKQNAAQLKKRYGKWRTQTKKNPQLGKDLHRVGVQGLSVLGYEPLRSFSDEDTVWGDEGYQCTLSPADCGFQEPVVDNRPCTLQESTDFRAGGLRIDLAVTPATSAQDCCRDCRGNADCKHFTYDGENNYCYLKSGSGTIYSGANAGSLTSGSI